MLQAQHPLAQGLVRGATAPVHTLRWPTTVTVKPKTSRQKQNTSRQNQKPHDKENLTAKPKTSRQKPIPHGGKTKDLTAKPNTSQQKPNTSRQNQIYFVFAVKYLVLP